MSASSRQVVPWVGWASPTSLRQVCPASDIMSAWIRHPSRGGVWCTYPHIPFYVRGSQEWPNILSMVAQVPDSLFLKGVLTALEKPWDQKN